MILHLLRKWLKKRLGITLSILPNNFMEVTKDGTLMAQVLHHYKIINDNERQSIEETKEPSVAYQNYTKYIREWLKRINLNLTDEDIEEIIFGEGAGASTSIFYELYMKLENIRGSVYNPKKQVFFVEKIKEEVSVDDVVFEANPLCEPLMKSWDLINWERDHLNSLMAKYIQSREEYEEYLEQKHDVSLSNVIHDEINLEDNLNNVKTKTSEYTYGELLAQQKAALEMEPFVPDIQEAKKILNHIKSKKKQKAERAKFCVEMQYQLMSEIWKKIDELEQDSFDKIVCEKLLKQSVHEKETAEKLINIRKQKDMMIKNRKLQDEYDRKRRDEEFIRRLFEESLEDQLDFHQKQMAIIEEHKRLYNEKLRLKALKHEKICKDIVDDFIDLAIKTAEYKERYGVEPNKYLCREWANLFIKQEAILDLIEPQQIKEPLPEDVTDELEEIYRREIKRQDVLDEQDFLDYINFSNFWQIDEGLEDFYHLMELGMNCLGYIVHKLLLKKYPLPIPQKPNLSQEIEISVCANNIPDFSKIDLFQRILQLRDIKVIRMEDAIDFCIKTYEKELKTEFDDPFPEEDYLRLVSPRKDKKEKKGKKGKKDKKAKKEKGGKKGKKGKKGAAKIEEVKVFEDKQAQTPVLFPWERIIFTNTAKLGRIAKQRLAQDEFLDDKLIIEMFIEYLSSMKDIKGWVLLNYPTNYNQAALLEQALTGKPAPKDYYDKVLNKESLESVKFDFEEVVDEAEGSKEEIQEYKIEDVEEEYMESPSIIDNVQVQELTAEMEFALQKNESRKYSQTSGCHSEFSGITILDDIVPAPKERVAELLPDLKDLAYSNCDILEEENEAKKKCVCVCNSERKEYKIEDEEENLLEEQLYEDEKKDCTCFMTNTDFEDEEIEYCDAIVQTDILALEQDIDYTEAPLDRAIAEDFYEENRLSKIVPNPRPFKKEDYCTVLTAFINIIENVKEDNWEAKENPIPCFKELEKTNGLEKFYCDQGCYYNLQYDEFNSETIKCLAKLVIGDYSLPLKNSIEIFGERYKEALIEDGTHKISKKGKGAKKEKKKKKGKKDGKSKASGKSKGKDKKSKSDKKSKKSKSSKGSKKGKGKKGKKGKVEEKPPVEYDDKEVQFPMVEEIEEEEIPEPRAGEADWEYIDLAIPEEVQLQVATLWDNFEENYYVKFKELFFNKRILLNDIVPFLTKVRETLNEFISRPDDKQKYLREFQKTLNQIDLDLRNDLETKTEILCRIDEFKEKLLEICDSKMRESEEERRNFIRQNWLFNQFCLMVNNTTIAFQLEIDRLVDTLQFLSDYYIAIITKSIKEGYEFHKDMLPKHECTEKNSEAFNKLFIDIDSENDENTEFHNYVEKCKNLVLDFMKSLEPLARKPVADMRKLFEPPQKQKKPKKSKKKETKFELDEDVKENVDRIFEEWECGINGEFARMNIHLNIIQKEAFQRLNNVIEWIKRIFERIFNDIKAKYDNEITSVQKACKLLIRSVEEEMIIQPELTFKGDQLAQIQVSLFPECFDAEEDLQNFTIQQIENMVKILIDLANNGYILKNTFLLLIQDILYQDENEDEMEIPKIWRNLSMPTLNQLLFRLYDDEKNLYWKDFVVCNLGIPFPSRQQLMDVRNQFRQFDENLTELVNWEDFNKIVFWFEDYEDLDRLKSTVFKMYQIDEENFNYTAMLLDFCKDENPILGFVKALELSLGRYICCDEAMGHHFLTEILEDRLLYEKKLREHEETIILAKRVVSRLIDKIINGSEEGFSLKELDDLSLGSRNTKSAKSASNHSQLSEGKIISGHKFSYTQIGFEARDDTELCYFLPLELVVIILNTEPTWNLKFNETDSSSFKQEIIEIYEECRNEKFNNVVLAHEFLNSEKLKLIFAKTNKFLALNSIKIVKEILYDSESMQEPEEFVLNTESKSDELSDELQ